MADSFSGNNMGAISMSFDEDRMDAEAQRHGRRMDLAPADGDGLTHAMIGLRAVYRAMSQLDDGKCGEELVELAEAARFYSTIIGQADDGLLRAQAS